MKNETARREIESLDYYLQNHTDDYSEESHTAMMMAIKALDVLDKIRAEIDKELLTYSKEVENMGDSAQKIRISLGIVRKIIDKYREESE